MRKPACWSWIFRGAAAQRRLGAGAGTGRRRRSRRPLAFAFNAGIPKASGIVTTEIAHHWVATKPGGLVRERINATLDHGLSNECLSYCTSW